MYARIQSFVNTLEYSSILFNRSDIPFSWFCHLDDDIYIIMKNLIGLLSKMNPKIEPRYVGRAGTPWKKPRSVSSGLCKQRNILVYWSALKRIAIIVIFIKSGAHNYKNRKGEHDTPTQIMKMSTFPSL